MRDTLFPDLVEADAQKFVVARTPQNTLNILPNLYVWAIQGSRL